MCLDVALLGLLLDDDVMGWAWHYLYRYKYGIRYTGILVLLRATWYSA